MCNLSTLTAVALPVFKNTINTSRQTCNLPDATSPISAAIDGRGRELLASHGEYIHSQVLILRLNKCTSSSLRSITTASCDHPIRPVRRRPWRSARGSAAVGANSGVPFRPSHPGFARGA
jgi:hypothetical protein